MTGAGDTGRAILERWAAGGDMPSLARTLGIRLVALGDGTVTAACRIGEGHLNLAGMVHGGTVAALFDAATGAALLSLLDAGERFATADLTVKYLIGIPGDVGDLYAEARIVHRGGRLALAEALARDAGGTVYARALATLSVSRPAGGTQGT